MTITLYLEYKGCIRTQATIPYAMRFQVADSWRNMYAGKEVTIFYKTESKLNYEKSVETEEKQKVRRLPRDKAAS